VGGRRWILRAAFAVVVLAVVVAALAVAGAVWWSGATLSSDPSALARLDLQPLAGSVESITASGGNGEPIALVDTDGRLTPRRLVRAGEQVRVAVVIRRPRWLGWVAGRTRHETLTVRAPTASVVDRWPVLTGGATLGVRFTSKVDRVVVTGDGRRRSELVGGRVLSLGAQRPTGAVAVAVAPRRWELPGAPIRISWFPETRLPAVQVSPAPGTEISALTPLRLTFAQPVGSARPHFSTPAPGTWRLVDSHTLVLQPGRLGFSFGASLRLVLPRELSIVAGGTTSSARSVSWTVAAGSVLRLHQLLAQEAYLPVVWIPTGPDVALTPAREVQAAVAPPDGTFRWRFPNTPSLLTKQWAPQNVTEITRGAVMMFEHENGLAVDGFAGPQVWRKLIADAIAGKLHQGGYSYVYVHTSLPQLLTLWHDGRTVLTSPGNTGIPATPTQPGTYPVFEHIPVGEMKGTNPDGSHYDDPGIRWISYFHGGDALHSFDRASFGTPQSLGCVELPLAAAAKVWPYTPIGTLVTIENPS
jgi:peptidoglycan hydrolase-like protein with peptidoglycan-binding domain